MMMIIMMMMMCSFTSGVRQRKALLKTKRVEPKIEVFSLSPFPAMWSEVTKPIEQNTSKPTTYEATNIMARQKSSIATIVEISIAAATCVGGFVGSYQTHKLWSYKDRIETTSIKISNIAFNVACNPFSAVAVWVAAVQFIETRHQQH